MHGPEENIKAILEASCPTHVGVYSPVLRLTASPDTAHRKRSRGFCLGQKRHAGMTCIAVGWRRRWNVEFQAHALRCGHQTMTSSASLNTTIAGWFAETQRTPMLNDDRPALCTNSIIRLRTRCCQKHVAVHRPTFCRLFRLQMKRSISNKKIRHYTVFSYTENYLQRIWNKKNLKFAL